MIYSIDFKEMAGKINHLHMAKYLRDLGWQEFPTKRQNVKIFQLQNEKDFFQVDMPADRGLRDYDLAMYRSVEQIAASVDKSVEQVLLELLNPLSDILRVRIRDKQVEDGSIFVEDALHLYENTKKLLIATARDILTPKSIHLGRPDNNVQAFISNCRFGQTEIGSYVVSVVCPFGKIDDGEFRQLTLFDDAEDKADSLTRQVTKKLIGSVQIIKEAIEKGNLLTEAGNDEAQISVNFLEALSDISLYKPDCELEITAKWAPTVKNNRLQNNTVSIDHDYYEPIQATVKKMKVAQDNGEKVFIGRISSLQAIPDASQRLSGTAKLVYISDSNRTATTTITLSKDAYNQAIEAHQYGKTVKVIGIMASGKINTIGFEILG